MTDSKIVSQIWVFFFFAKSLCCSRKLFPLNLSHFWSDSLAVMSLQREFLANVK